MFARSQPPTSDPSTIFKVACDRLRTFNDARGGQTRFASRIRANPTGRGRREREREEWRNEGPGGIVIPSTSLVSLFFSSSSLLSSQVRTFFSLFLFEEGKGVENRERYPFLDSLPERQSLLRFTTVFRKMYRRAPRYTTNCPSLVCCLVSPFLAIFTITDFADRDDYLLEERGEREKKFLAKSGDRCIVSVRG